VSVRLAVSLPVYVEGRRAPSWWATALLVANDGALFACLLFAYFYIRSRAAAWPPGDMKLPELQYPIPMTILLVGSSIPIWWAEHSITQGQVGRLKIGLLLAWLMGLGFLALQVLEYHQKDFAISTNAYGSLFYAITALHGAHVFVALVMNGLLQVRTWKGHFDRRKHLAVQNVALYWHFVDAVWICIFLSLYLSPRLVRP